MLVHPIKSGKLCTKNNIFLAPIAGYTDYPFRHLILPLGVGLCFTELVSAKGVMFGGNNNESLLENENDEELTSAQIFGQDPYYMRCACENEQLSNYKYIDINMGCPVPKVFKNGEGSALLTDIKRAENIIKECVKSGKAISIKIRTGLKVGDDIATDFAKMAQDAGASLITIHGRVRESYYSGEVDYEAIRKAKNAVSIPVIANGGIFTVEDADNMIERTGADGIMIARGALSDPFIFSKLTNTTPYITKKDFIINHIKNSGKFYGEKRASLEFRKFVSYYFKGVNNLKEEKLALLSKENTTDIIEILERIL